MQCGIRSDLYKNVLPMFVGCKQVPAGHSCGPRVREFWLLHCVLSGKGIYGVAGRKYHLAQGDCFLIRPGEVTFYQGDREDPWKYVWFAFQSDRPELWEKPYVFQEPELIRLAQQVFDCEKHSLESTAAFIWQALGLLCPFKDSAATKGYIADAKSIVHKCYMQSISVQSIAEQIGLNRSYFSELFKQETGESPGQYLLRYRMKKAMEFLNSGYNVSVVAASVGYSDMFTFSRCFKRFYGKAPSCYGLSRKTNKT